MMGGVDSTQGLSDNPTLDFADFACNNLPSSTRQPTKTNVKLIDGFTLSSEQQFSARRAHPFFNLQNDIVRIPSVVFASPAIGARGAG